VLRRARLVARFLRIALVFAAAPLRLLGRLLAADEPPDAAVRERWQGEIFASCLETLGATFVKLGQILGSRPDLLPPGWLGPLARLQDDVAPAPWPEIRALLDAEVGLARFASVDPSPIAAASVAQVHRGALPDGTRLAIKIQRPEARDQIERDLFLMRALAGALDAVPTLHLLSLPRAIERFGDALSAQLDFAKEAENVARMAKNFRREKQIRFPRVHAELSTARVLTMDFEEGVKATHPERLPALRATGKELAALGGRAILQMVFVDGFVHADLHPGNILLREDGTLTFLDLGLVAEIPADLMRPWCDTFRALAERQGEEAARLFWEHAPSVGPDVDYRAYERDVLEYLGRLWGVRLGEIEVGAVVSGMMNVLRRHGVQIDASFTVVNVGLLVAEGLGKQLDPEVDLVALALPYLAQAQLTAPPGRPPRRTIAPAAAGGL
jgi:ubiquinone biosynthesis protein